MKASAIYDAYKFEKGSVTKVSDSLTIEAPLQISINGKPFTVVMQTPGAEKELAIGLMYAENVFHQFDQIKLSTKSDKGFVREVHIESEDNNLADGYLSIRSLLSVSSCGICGKREIKDINLSGKIQKTTPRFTPAQIIKAHQLFNDQQSLFKRTGGCHGIAVFDEQLNCLASYEDIGRHNALDKAVGHCILNNTLKKADLIAFSGRVSYEIVSKAFRAKTPVISAVSAPSTLAIEMAKDVGIAVVGFTRKEKFTVYSAPERIKL